MALVAVALAASVLAIATGTSPAGAAPVAVPAPAIRITELSYQLRDFGEAEFVELTNVGTSPVNLAGWSFDDVDGVIGAFDLSGFGVVAPGESVIITDVTPAAFRAYFGLAPSVKVVGGSTQGLGNGDQVNIWDDAGVLVDRLTYDDTPRSRDNSVVPAAIADVGANLYDNWQLSSAANDPGSVTVDQIAGGPTSIGSPGASTYATASLAGPVVPIRISEFSYQLRDFGEAEFVELTNVGPTPVNLAGWSFSDSTTPAGTFDLSGLGVVAAGESVVFTDVAAGAFRDYWDLCSAVKVLGGSAPGLGNGDAIRIWDDAANLVDQVAYGTTPRSRDNSVVPNAATVLAADDYANWELSSAANDPGSVTVDEVAGAPTSVASPGTSEYATVAFTPACPPPTGTGGIDLTTYGIVGRHPLPTHLDTPAPPVGSELATEVSAITYNWDTDTLFVVGDEGTSVVQVSKTGQLIDSMTLAAGQFEDTEGLSYVGGGQFVLAEERLRQVVLFTYEGGGVLEDTETQAAKIGSTIGNIGLEGVSYDPLSSDGTGPGFIGVKESGPLGLFQTNIDFAAGTASNGSPTTEPTNLFDPALVGTSDLSDVFPLSLLPDVDGGESENLLIISQESGRIVNIDRDGAIANQLDIVDVGGPLAVPAQTMEGVTVDRDGIMYTTSEGGGGDATHPQLLVWAPGASPLARLAVTEVAPWGSDTSYAADWFELTNTGATTLDLTGVKVDDGSNAPASAALLTGVPDLTPGQSAVFIEQATGADPTAVVAAFELAWFGEEGAPAGLEIGTYTGASLGLSGSGDSVNIFAADDARVTGVAFGAATANVTFDNTARVGAVVGPVAISDLAAEGVHGAFLGADGLGLGSPGNLGGPTGPIGGDPSGIRITEVAPWGSGNGPYAADWVEITNTGTESVSLNGWRLDDSSALYASGVELIGVPTLPAGASAIFFEGTNDAAFELAFAQAWFGQNLFDAGFFFGHYTGGGVGLSTGGDGVTLFDSAGTVVTGVAFGASPAAAPYASFDNAAGVGAAAAPFPTLTTLSAAGTAGAFLAVDGHGIGSPGFAPPPAVPTVSIDDAIVVEGDAGTVDLVFPVTLSEPATSTVTVDWATGSGAEPTAGTDYVAASGTVTFLPGETESTVVVTVFGDTIDEPGQAYGADWLGVVLSNPSGATLPPGPWANVGFGLILDDDPAVLVSIGNATVVEGDAGTVELVFPVTLSEPSASTVTVDWATGSGAEPTAGTDYAAASGTVTFLPGETEHTVVVTVFGDTIDEPGQVEGADWLGVALSNPTNASLPVGPWANVGFGRILDDD